MRHRRVDSADPTRAHGTSSAGAGGRAGADFEAFFRAEHPRLVRLALAQTGVHEVAIDISQEAMSRALVRWPSVSTMENPGAWVRRVAANLVTDWHRSNSRFQRFAPRLVDMGADTTMRAESAQFWAAVRALPDTQRSVVALYYLEDRSVGEIAAILEIADGTVKSALSRAREALARAIGADEDETGEVRSR